MMCCNWILRILHNLQKNTEGFVYRYMNSASSCGNQCHAFSLDFAHR